MYLQAVLDRFTQKSPVTLMTRAALENALAPYALDELFGKHSEWQYERTLLFSSVVDVMGMVVCRLQPSIHTAYKAVKDTLPVSLVPGVMLPDQSDVLPAWAVLQSTGSAFLLADPKLPFEAALADTSVTASNPDAVRGGDLDADGAMDVVLPVHGFFEHEGGRVDFSLRIVEEAEP